jgi:hypothetical protein
MLNIGPYLPEIRNICQKKSLTLLGGALNDELPHHCSIPADNSIKLR